MRSSKPASSRDRLPALGRPRETVRPPLQCQCRSDGGATMRTGPGTGRRNPLGPSAALSRRTALPPSPFGIPQSDRNSREFLGTHQCWAARRLPNAAVLPLVRPVTGTPQAWLFLPSSWPQAMHSGSRDLASTTTSARLSPAPVGRTNRRWPTVECHIGSRCEVEMPTRQCLPTDRRLRWRQG